MTIQFSNTELREVFGETLVELGREYPKMMVLDADLNTSARTVLFKDAFPHRFVQCGIAEANMMGIAGALAAEGFTPQVSTFAAFAAKKAADQVYMNIAYPNLNVKIPASYAGMTAAECGPSHNCAEDLAIMRAMPFMRVLALGDNQELKSAMRVMMETPGPFYYRVPKIKAPILFGDGHQFALGKGYVLREGKHLSIIGTGLTTGICLAAADRLVREGIEATVVHMPCIKPIDDDLIEQLSIQTQLLMTVENHRIYGGLGGAVAESAASRRPCRVERVGLGDALFESAPLSHLLKHYGFTPSNLAHRAKQALADMERT
jgi:transketolase